MGELIADNSVLPSTVILWTLYPMAVVVGLELFLRALTNDDDDDDEGGGVMTPVHQGAGT